MSADVVFYAPPGELLAEADAHVDDLRAHPNPEKRKRRRRDWVLDESALEFYGEWQTLLVRTALIRARGYDPANRPRAGSFEEVGVLVRHLTELNYEMVLTICVDARNRVNAIHESAKGGLHGAAVTPKDVLVVPLLTASSGFILVHNHPSGDMSPSADDIEMTRALIAGGKTIGVPMLDHIVVAEGGMNSLRDYMDF